MSSFSVLPSGGYGSMKAMEGFRWTVPAKVLAVIGGNTFLVDADLGFDVHAHVYVKAYGIDTPDDLPARKEAQRLLTNADVVLFCKGRVPDGDGWLCEVAYGPYFTPRSEQASFAAAMVAAGHAIPMEANAT